MCLLCYDALMLLFMFSYCRAICSSTGTLSDQEHQRTADSLFSQVYPFGQRPGNASRSHSCNLVREVPLSFRFFWIFKPTGIQQHYQKYTEAYGIPVIGSRNVSDDALTRACYVLRFLLADHSKIRQSYYKYFGRVVVIGLKENITDLPEYSFLQIDMNDRARGLGPTETLPVASGAEENLLCQRPDRYFGEDILLHELAHGVHMVAKYEIHDFQSSLMNVFIRATISGLWTNTYSSTSMEEYLAEGIQSYFRVNSYSDPANGVHGPINSPEKLLTHDPDLYHMIELLFPCGNQFMETCQSNLSDATNQELKMDCDLTREYQSSAYRIISEKVPQPRFVALKSSGGGAACTDNNIHCESWSKTGECLANPAYMLSQCKLSCGVCEHLVS